jgi:hypothetical protein
VAKQDNNKGPETEGQKQGEEPVVDTSSLQVTDENDDPVDMPPEGADEKDDLTKGLPEGFESVEQLVDAFNDMKNKSSDADDKDDEGSDDKDDEGSDKKDDEGSDDESDDNNQTKDNKRIRELELQLHDREVYDLVGGKEKYEEMQAWADNALDEDEADTFNQVFDSSDIKAKRVAAKALQAMYERENGFEGERINGNTPAGITPIRSDGDLMEAMQDARYRRKDSVGEAYRADVEKRMVAGQRGKKQTNADGWMSFSG